MALSRGLLDSLDDGFVIQQPVSRRRRESLLRNYLHERQQTRTTELLFDRVGGLEKKLLHPSEQAGRFGFKAIVFKHSFIDGINSNIVSAQGWAVGQEEFLLKYFGETLQSSAARSFGSAVNRAAPAILLALDEMASELRDQGYTPSASVITGSIGRRLYEELQHAVLSPSEWYWRLGIHHGRATHRFIGLHADVPIVAIEAVRLPMVYVVDLAQFATLIRYGVGPNFDPEFKVQAFSDAEAREILARQPDLILDPPPESGLDDERVRQLQLRVGLELWETYKLDVKDPGAVIARPLADPVYE